MIDWAGSFPNASNVVVHSLKYQICLFAVLRWWWWVAVFRDVSCYGNATAVPKEHRLWTYGMWSWWFFTNLKCFVMALNWTCVSVRVCVCVCVCARMFYQLLCQETWTAAACFFVCVFFFCLFFFLVSFGMLETDILQTNNFSCCMTLRNSCDRECISPSIHAYINKKTLEVAHHMH